MIRATSATGVTSTVTATGVLDTKPELAPLSRASTVNAAKPLPLTSRSGVQKALVSALMVSLLPAAQADALWAVIPKSRLPLVTAFTT